MNEGMQFGQICRKKRKLTRETQAVGEKPDSAIAFLQNEKRGEVRGATLQEIARGE